MVKICVTLGTNLFGPNILSFLHGQTCTEIPEMSFSVPNYEAVFCHYRALAHTDVVIDNSKTALDI